MEEIEFKTIRPSDKGFFDIYNEVLSWDDNHTYFPNTDHKEDFDLYNLIQTGVICYYKDELIGYGTMTHFSNTNISYIINPKYRGQGYGKKLVEYLISRSYRKYGASCTINAEILKDNIESISLIESCDFSMDHSKDKTIVYTKKFEL